MDSRAPCQGGSANRNLNGWSGRAPRRRKPHTSDKGQLGPRTGGTGSLPDPPPVPSGLGTGSGPSPPSTTFIVEYLPPLAPPRSSPTSGGAAAPWGESGPGPLGPLLGGRSGAVARVGGTPRVRGCRAGSGGRAAEGSCVPEPPTPPPAGLRSVGTRGGGAGPTAHVGRKGRHRRGSARGPRLRT